MNSHDFPHHHIGLRAYNRVEYDANGLLLNGFQAMPLRWRLPVFVRLLLFGIGIVVGIQLERQTPEMPASVNVCRADEVDRIDCVHVPQPVPTAVGVVR
ncbi:hypothetical protein [Nocardia seriolae]|uniref:Uncharacterized protein n=1 Tax=Nocardia seriolae TaxID=37332 RepID=A0A0B8NPH1_9NOCA|nr:hypothetical protein [Nocardia seriolae]APA97595.1 hypothetical protein NS506_03543 [Nocardia seriolae]MTJ62480.1 hypothetical protein [Nocardia seriolae]MTJ75506.1 hypothetical protein [Nocardia seriolae]MTJ87381.1 hypothetical protein [Nocardia seriolae]MTK31373.1 hypothetical protein [Nocardia seriolae]